MTDQPALDTATFTFTQEGNTLGTTEEVESITIRLETQLPGEMPFFVIVTQGWSFDDPEELLDIVEQCRKALEP